MYSIRMSGEKCLDIIQNLLENDHWPAIIMYSVTGHDNHLLVSRGLLNRYRAYTYFVTLHCIPVLLKTIVWSKQQVLSCV